MFSSRHDLARLALWPPVLGGFYRQHLELVYREDSFRVDEELESLGIPSNRQVESLGKLIDLLADQSRCEIA